MPKEDDHHRANDVSLDSVNAVLILLKDEIKEFKEIQKDGFREVKETHKAMWSKIDIQNEKIQKLETKTSNIELKLVGVGVGVTMAWDWLKNKL